MHFKSIIGQERIKQQLINNVNQQRISHALLFHGPDGTGKLQLALAFIQYLMCENKLANDSCGECAACLKNKKLVHPDVHYSFPFVKTKNKEATTCDDYIDSFRTGVLSNQYMSENDWVKQIDIENKQTLISVHESNNIIRKLSLKSFESQYKVSLIWNADKLIPAAANKLLKIIEEPPNHTIFVLITNNAESLLPTLVSRTQLISVAILSDEIIKTELANKEGLTETHAGKIAHISNGSFKTALELSETEGSEDYIENYLEWMRLCFKAINNIDKLLDWVDQIAQTGRENQKVFLNIALEVVRECLLINSGSKSLVRIKDEDIEKIERFAPFIHQNNVNQIINELNSAHTHISRNAYAKILFLDLSLKMHRYLNIGKEELITA